MRDVLLGCSSLLLEEVGEFFDVLDGVFEGLYFGERLSSAAVHRRQVIAELMQRLRQTPHAELLALAGLHPPLHAHLHFGLLLLAVFASGQRLRGRAAHGIERLGLRRGRAAALVRVSKRPVLSAPAPLGQNLGRVRVDLDLLHLRARRENAPVGPNWAFIPANFTSAEFKETRAWHPGANKAMLADNVKEKRK